MKPVSPASALPAQRAPLRSAWLPALLFWAAWALMKWQWPHARWVALSAQLWLAYSAAWLVLPSRWLGLALPLAAAAGALLGAGLSPDVTLASWLQPQGPVLRAALPAFAFALLMHLPLRWWRWREEQALALRLVRAEQAAAMAELSRQVSVTELKTLQAQVDPHFLFNALASLQQLIRSQPATAERFLGERLHFDVQAEPGCEGLAMLLLLLTLVENAVRHGIEPQPRGGHVRIDARRDAGRLVVEVRDTGVGLQAEPTAKGQGVGLANVRDRLAGLYGDDARLTVQQRAEGGVCARIEIPLPATG